MENDFGLVPQVADMPLDLNKDEKVRAMALMLAVNHHKSNTVQDADMYRTLKTDGHAMNPLTDQTVINSALRFETFIRCGENPERMAFIEQIADGLDDLIAEEPDAA